MPTVNSSWDANTPGPPFLRVAGLADSVQARFAVYMNDARLQAYMRAKQIKGLRAILHRRMRASGKAVAHSGNLSVLISNIVSFNTRFMSSRLSPLLEQQLSTVNSILRDGMNGRYAHDSNVWNLNQPAMTLQCFQTLQEQTHLSTEFVSNMLVLLRSRDKLLVDSFFEVNVTASTPEPRKRCLYFSPNYLNIFLGDNTITTLVESAQLKADFDAEFFKCYAAYFPSFDEESKEWFLICICMSSKSIVIHFPKYSSRPEGLIDRSAAIMIQLQQSLVPVISHFAAVPPALPAVV